MTREEAIEVYHELLNQKIKEAFEVFAPELKESEDERIRMALISYLNKMENCGGVVSFNGFSIKEYITYLEKQKEQKPVDLEKTVEFNCIGKQVTMTIQELIDYYIDREGTDVAIECGF